MTAGTGTLNLQLAPAGANKTRTRPQPTQVPVMQIFLQIFDIRGYSQIPILRKI